MRYYILMAMMLLLGAGSAKASAYDDTSVAGLFPVSNQGREVWNFNRSEEHTSELQSRFDLVCRLLLEKKKKEKNKKYL